MKKPGRYFLKDSIRKTVDFSMTDQNMGVEPLPVQKPCPPGAARVDLPGPDPGRLGKISLADAIGRRESRRQYREEYLSIEELSFLLWATQGLKEAPSGGHSFRTVPSAGCRHAIETYLAAFRVKGLEKGIYRYLPVEHQLTAISHPAGIERLAIGAALNQKFAGSGAATFISTSIP